MILKSLKPNPKPSGSSWKNTWPRPRRGIPGIGRRKKKHKLSSFGGRLPWANFFATI